MKRPLILTALLAVLLPAYAVTGIAGTVTDAVTGLPIDQALVGTNHGEEAYTGPDGRYLIELAHGGTYLPREIRATATGYEGGSYPDTVFVAEGHVTEHIDFALRPEGRGVTGIAGMVTDAVTGLPIDQALVGTNHGEEAYTGPDGRYLIELAHGGAYLIRALATGYEPASYPDTVFVTDGQVTEDIDIALRPEGGGAEFGCIAGRVYDAYDLHPIDSATVTASGPDGERHVLQLRDGYLIDSLAPGSYWVTAAAPGYEPGCYPESVDVAGGQRVAGIDVALANDSIILFDVGEGPAVAKPTKVSLGVDPNPFHGLARLSWQVPVAGFVTVRLFDNTGRVVRTLQRGYQQAGTYSTTWNGIGSAGQRLADGVYYCRLDVNGHCSVQKVVLSAR